MSKKWKTWNETYWNLIILQIGSEIRS